MIHKQAICTEIFLWMAWHLLLSCEGEVLAKYQQWQTLDKRPEKVTITATIHDIFDALRAQPKDFLVHRFIKRNQAAHFAQLTAGCDGCSVVLQVNFSENATLLQQDEIQSAH